MSRPVRVLIVAPAPLGDTRIGGIANFIGGFVRHMPDDFEAEIVGVAVADEAPGSDWRTMSFAGRDIRFLPAARTAGARRSGRIPTKAVVVAGMLRHRKRIKTAGRVAQVHSPAMELGLLGRRLPVVRVVHNAPADLAANTGESTWRRFGRGLHLLERLTFSRADRVFFVNRATHAEYAARFDPRGERLHYLPNGIDTTLFRPLDDGERDAVRRELAARLAVAPDDRWLVYAGRLDQQKDPQLLLRGFAALPPETASASRLLVVGEGRLRADCERLVQALGIGDRVSFLGLWQREELARLMGASDGFVLASAFEAAPFVVFEALASGLPVASTAVGEVPALVEHGVTGWIAPERTPSALAEAITWLLEQPRDEIAARCAASMEPYQLSRVLEPFYDAHRMLADAGRPGRTEET